MYGRRHTSSYHYIHRVGQAIGAKVPQTPSRFTADYSIVSRSPTRYDRWGVDVCKKAESDPTDDSNLALCQSFPHHVGRVS